MRKESKLTPNTHLGAVHWWSDLFWGTHLWLCQDALGMRKEPRNGFLDPTWQSVEDMREYFGEVETEDGRLALELYLDSSYQMTVLATIETTFRADENVTDQMFLNLVGDFVEHVQKLPLANPGDGAGTEEELDEAFRRGKEIMDVILQAVDEATGQKQQPELPKDKDDILF